MTAGELAARYIDLGGDPDHSTRRTRRGGNATPASRPVRTMPMLDEFIDDVDDEPNPGQPSTASLWAPFVLIGP